MSEQPEIDWSPVKVEQEILSLSNQIANGVVVCNDLLLAFLAADREYDYRYARAYLDYDGPAHEKRYAAEVVTRREREQRDLADASLRLARDRAAALSDQLRAMQSIGASVRMMYGSAGRGEY